MRAIEGSSPILRWPGWLVGALLLELVADLGELPENFLEAVVATVGILLQTAVDQCAQLGRALGAADRDGIVVDNLVEGGRDRVLAKRTLAGDQLVGEDTVGKDVGAGIRGLATDLFGRQVLGGSAEGGGL